MTAEGLAADTVRQSWAATIAALPAGARIKGEVIGRQRSGLFIRIDGVPNAVGLAEIGSMARDLELPAMGAEVASGVRKVWVEGLQRTAAELRTPDWSSGSRCL